MPQTKTSAELTEKHPKMPSRSSSTANDSNGSKAPGGLKDRIRNGSVSQSEEAKFHFTGPRLFADRGKTSTKVAALCPFRYFFSGFSTCQRQ